MSRSALKVVKLDEEHQQAIERAAKWIRQESEAGEVEGLYVIAKMRDGSMVHDRAAMRDADLLWELEAAKLRLMLEEL